MISRTLLALAACLPAWSAFAAPVLDQQVGNLAGANLFAPIYTNVWNINHYETSEATQTFTVGITGQLSGIDFYCCYSWPGAAASLTVQVWNLNAVSPDILSWHLPPGGGIGWVGEMPGAVLLGSTNALAGSPLASQADFENQDINVAKGDFLAFVVDATGSAEATMVGTTPFSYSGGAAYRSDVNVPGYDYIFSTYVDPPTPVPEPSGWLVLMIGIFGLATFRMVGKRPKQTHWQRNYPHVQMFA